MSKRARTKDELMTLPEENEEMKDVISRVKFERNDMSLIFDQQRDFSQNWAPKDLTFASASVEPITRAEVAAHLRSPAPGTQERECVCGERCQGRFLMIPASVSPVTLVEHYTPTAPQPKEPQMCILCKRSLCCYMYINAVAEGDSMDQVFTEHCNIVNEKGEYCLDQCLIAGRRSTHGMLQPVALHCRAWYQYAGQQDGVTWFTEAGYKVFQ